MKVLIAYASTEGQTRKIARFCADHLIDTGHSVELAQAGDAKDIALDRFDAVLLAGSVHAGRYQKGLRKLAQRQCDGLAGMKAAFMSVSLAAAGDDPADWDGLRACVDRFAEVTGWTPATVMHVAGAFRFSEYDFFKSWAMRWIAAQKGQSVDPHEDKEYTDWDALKETVDQWLADG
jgi:menaquinone-dependent protoporphyrinogen oxidase